MIFVFITILFLGLLVWCFFKDNDELGTVLLVLIFFFLAIMIASLLITFARSADLEAEYTAVVEQYRDAIEVYTDAAVVIKVDVDTFTDFRYQGYQESVAELITDLRNRVAAYNRNLIKIRKYNSHPFFSWIYVVPDDSLKIINLKWGDSNGTTRSV